MLHPIVLLSRGLRVGSLIAVHPTMRGEEQTSPDTDLDLTKSESLECCAK